MKILLASLLFLSPLVPFSLAFADETPLTVHLSTESRMAPLYLHLNSANSELPKSHLQALEKVICFDFNMNGRTQVIKTRADLNSLLESANPFVQARWKEERIPYVVQLLFEGRSVSLFTFASEKNRVKHLDKVELSGNLASDRRKMHALADAAYEAFFDSRGIASTRILYTERIKNGSDSSLWQSLLVQADYDGANAMRLSSEASGKLIVTPTYIPEKSGRAKHYLYVSYATGQPKIYIGSLSEKESKRLTLLRGNQLMPALSPKSDLVAFVSDIAGNPELFVQGFDKTSGVIGKPWQITSFPEGAQASPTFSPDGKRIAFVSNKEGSPRIYVTSVAAPESSVKSLKVDLISRLNRENTSPTWSPDGQKLAYSALSGGVRQIWLYDFKRREERVLTAGPGHKESPSWAPSSEHLVYHQATASGSELYLLHIEEKKPVLITSGGNEKRFPAWEPFR